MPAWAGVVQGSPAQVSQPHPLLPVAQAVTGLGPAPSRLWLPWAPPCTPIPAPSRLWLTWFPSLQAVATWVLFPGPRHPTSGTSSQMSQFRPSNQPDHLQVSSTPEIRPL